MAGLRASWRVNRLLSRARALLLHGKAAEAEPLCREAVALAPQSAKAWLYLNWTLLNLNRSSEALEACDRAISIDSRNDWAWTDKGVALNQLKRYDESLTALAHVPLHSSNALRANWARYVALYRSKDFNALCVEAERLIKYNPDEPRHWYWLGHALDALKHYDEALSAYARSTELDPQYISGWTGQALTLYNLKRFADALDVCEHVFAMSPENMTAVRVRVLCLLAERRFDEAIAACEHVLTLPNIAASDYHNTGVALLRAGRYVDAMSLLAQALAMEPDRPSSLNGQGIVYSHFQYDERALSVFERVCALDNDYFASWANAGGVLTHLGRYEDARERLARAAMLATDQDEHFADAEIAALQGVIHARQEQFDEALAAFKQAMVADSQNDVVCKSFAELLLALGETEKAASMIERALTLSPFDARVWSLKGRILRAAGDAGGAEAAEAHGQAMLAEQRAQLAAWEREHPEWAEK